MTYQEFKENLCSFDPSKECFCFLAERIGDDNYRGIQCSQHNRYDDDVIFTILDELHNAAGEEKMIIRTADLKKRPRNLPEEAAYAKYVSTLCNKLGRCTQDSVRKNLFVDLHRMGLLERFNSTGKMLDPYENGTKKYVRISKQGLDFIDKGHTLFERKLRYTRAIDTLTRGLAAAACCVQCAGCPPALGNPCGRKLPDESRENGYGGHWHFRPPSNGPHSWLRFLCHAGNLYAS